MIKTKILSSLEKCFIDQTPDDFAEVRKLNMYRGERAIVQFAVYDGDESDYSARLCHVITEGELSEYITLRTVENVINYCPAFATPEKLKELDPGYVRTTPGLYPDILVPPMKENCVPVINQQLHTAYLFIEGDILPGNYQTTVKLTQDDGSVLSQNTFEVTVFPEELPPAETKVTNWLYTDCLADYYRVEPWSDRHFEICRNYIECATKNGINMILMPVFTVSLDTHIGGERTTTQLVGVTVLDGHYSFDYTLADRWIDICLESGVKYFEISHLFTQWGAKHAPKIMATVNGELKRIFGWDTDASDSAYVAFLRAFLASFTEHMDSLGLKERTYFHLSDEPQERDIEQYKSNHFAIADLLDGWKILDATSHVEYYKTGLVKIPVPDTRLCDDFLKEDIKERWVYYCCDPWQNCSNRLIANSLPRTRSLGMQMYKYDVVGHLQWGYNFYNNQGSYDSVNPFLNTAAGYWGVSGDAFVVYPGNDGKPLESIRLCAYKQGLDDIRILKLAESKYGKKAVLERIEAVTGQIDFHHCVDDTATMQLFRDTLDDMIHSL